MAKIIDDVPDVQKMMYFLLMIQQKDFSGFLSAVVPIINKKIDKTLSLSPEEQKNAKDFLKDLTWQTDSKDFELCLELLENLERIPQSIAAATEYFQQVDDVKASFDSPDQKDWQQVDLLLKDAGLITDTTQVIIEYVGHLQSSAQAAFFARNSSGRDKISDNIERMIARFKLVDEADDELEGSAPQLTG